MVYFDFDTQYIKGLDPEYNTSKEALEAVELAFRYKSNRKYEDLLIEAYCKVRPLYDSPETGDIVIKIDTRRYENVFQ